MLFFHEILRWIGSPTRRLLVLAYGGIIFSLLWVLWRFILIFIYQRLLFTVFVRDLDYVYQVTHFIGGRRYFGWAFYRSPAKARFRMIILGRRIFSIPLPVRKQDPRKFNARLLHFLKNGPEASERWGIFMHRLSGRTDFDKLLFRAAVGLGDPALTGMAASNMYLLTSFLPQEENRYAAVFPMFDRDGLDIEAEVAVGFRVYRTFIPALLFFLNPLVIRFAWRWRFPKLSKEPTPAGGAT